MDKKTLPAPAFTRDIIEELKKVTWPSRENTIRLTLVVVGMSLIIGLYIGIIDILLTKGLEFLTKYR
ncbi:preprotein translocase subunit SecE [Candidatus Roizmanbacteria bacterium RIFCSPLOWO2_01_FULL_37_12]|uniref:Protein translocase subunit SecE n=1 Tax=Candidatus Roizmanbacteria bacterium RIFCSPLOWO2_01_FULL_37_12 TaxID=1802056 RepID=A0A1F7IEZ5_9BACT|nr:MAG: preprotein translocase subunit SecE [Candidatus Roizmanbacteria bacterium RIFCSPLOWO2_01_FULL_37_12]